MAKRKRASKRQPRIRRRASQTKLLLDRAALLLDQGDATAALELLDQAESTLSDNPDYHALKASALMQLDYFIEAVEHAQTAASLAPDQPAFLGLLAISYQGAGYLTLAYRVRQTCAQLDPTFFREFPTLDGLDEDYHALIVEMKDFLQLESVEAVENLSYLLERGNWAMVSEQWPDAVPLFRRALAMIPSWVPTRNSLSLCLYYSGELAQAMAEAESVLADYDPTNIEALGNMVRYELAIGHDEQARAFADRLIALPLTEDDEEAVYLVEALSLLERDKDVERIVRRFSEHQGATPDELLRYQGIALANLGRRREAIALLERAQDVDPDPFVEETLKALHAGRQGRGLSSRFSTTSFLDWMPYRNMDRLQATLASGIRLTQSARDTWRNLAERFPQLVIALRKLLFEDHPDDSEDALEAILGILWAIGTPRALEVLRSYAQDPAADQAHRLVALHYLQSDWDEDRDG